MQQLILGEGVRGHVHGGHDHGRARLL